MNISSNDPRYEVYNDGDLGNIDLIADLLVEVSNPENSAESGINYQQGDDVALETSLNTSCGISPNVSGQDIIWNASDKDTSKLISSGPSASWSIPESYTGETNISAYGDSYYYRGGLDTKTILIERVININVTEGLTDKTRTIGGNYDYNFAAEIVTGDRIDANESTINETWSDFNITWKIDGNKVKEQSTDSQASASTSINLGSQYEPGEHTVQAELENTSSINTTILQEKESKDLDFIDEASVTLEDPAGGDIFYQDEIDLRSSINTATGNEDSMDINYNWLFKDNDTERVISSSRISSWIVPSYAYGPGNISVVADHPYLQSDSDKADVTSKRKTSIKAYDPYKYVEPNSENPIRANISIPGVEDKSGYTVNYWIAGNSYTAKTDEGGTATFYWDPSGLEKGAYDTGVSIEDAPGSYYETENPTQANKTLVIPDVLNISASYRDNNEENANGNNFPKLPDKVVYRNGGPWQHPEKLYLAGNVTTPFPDSDEKYEVENSTVKFWITGTSDEGQQITEKIGEDDVNLTEFENARNDNENTWWDEYLAHTSWDPRGEFPVGSYDLKINATHPEDGFEPDPVTRPLEVRGTLNVSVTDPVSGEDSFQMDNFTMKAEVTDMNGNEFDDSDLDGIYWTLDEDGCANGGSGGRRNDHEVINWDDAIAHGNRNSLDTWIIPGNPSSNSY
ncbi:MAG: hypothetical protein BRC30_03955, partial [Nanohaloarchaea archaeon SW_7_46_7]